MFVCLYVEGRPRLDLEYPVYGWGRRGVLSDEIKIKIKVISIVKTQMRGIAVFIVFIQGFPLFIGDIWPTV